MNEKEQILNSIEKYGSFLIPSRREIYSIVCDITKLTESARELFRENLIDWSAIFEKNSNWVLLTKPRDNKYTLSEVEKRCILNRLEKTNCYILKNRKQSKIKNWSDHLNFLKSLAKEGDINWALNFQSKKYCFYKDN